MTNMNEETKVLTRIKQEVADKISQWLIGSADEAKKICVTRYVGEPNYPLELLRDD